MSAPNAAILTILENCERLIAQGKTAKAIDQLTSLEEKKYRKRFIPLSNQFKTLEEQFRSGILTHEAFQAKVTQVNTSILATMEWVESDLKTKPIVKGNSITKIVIGAAFGLLILALGYYFFPKEDTLDCPNGHKKAVFIAKFKDNNSDGFSNSVISKLRGDLAEVSYSIGGSDFQTLDAANYRENIQANFFETTCDTSGLFCGGLWDKENQVFNCYIDLFKLPLKIPGMEDNPTIILNNPDGISFSVKEDATFLANFIIALLKTYEGAAYEALKLFSELEKDTALLQDEKLRAYILLNKGNCYAMRGDQLQAEAQYREAEKLLPALKTIARKNSEMAIKIAEVMEADPDLAETLRMNIAQDSIFEGSSFGKNDPDQLIQENSNENEAIETVAEKLNLANEKNELEKSIDQPFTAMDKDLEQSGKSTQQPGLKIEDIKTIQIAGKIWMKENLSVDIGEGCWFYENDSGNDKIYGRLYTWSAAKQACKSFGEGWRLPTDKEWRDLAKQYGGTHDDASDGGAAAYKALREGGHSGFSALLAGHRNTNGGFKTLGDNGFYWSATRNGADQARAYYFGSYNRTLYRNYYNRDWAFSCRCVQNIDD